MTTTMTTTTTQQQSPSIAERLWMQAQRKAYQSLYHPFVASLAAGTLAKQDFQAFLLQDAFYLNVFAKAFAYAATKTTCSDHTLAIIRRMSGIEIELRTHAAFLESFGIELFHVDESTAAPATLEYVNFLLTTAKRSDSVAEILAAMTPCIRLYGFLGESIAAAAKQLPQRKELNPYQLWIDTYSTEAFASTVKEAELELDEIATYEGVRYETLLPLYNTAMELELRFFEQNFPMARAGAVFPPAALAFPMNVHVTVDGSPSDEELLKSEAASWTSNNANGVVLDVASVASLQRGQYQVCIDKEHDNHFSVAISRVVRDELPTKELSTPAVPLLTTLLSASSPPPAARITAQNKAELVTFLTMFTARGSIASFAEPAFQWERRVARVLTIAGSDSGGGAGIQADMKACTNLGVFSTSAITAVTVQNTTGVHSIHAIPVNEIADQITCVLDDIGTDVVKTGMLATEEIIEMVAAVLKHRQLPLVMDPVMIATSGDRLLKEAAHQSMVAKLFPLATIITPNIPETSVLLNDRVIETIEDMKRAALDLAQFGPAFVLVKGGHLVVTPPDDCVHDVLLDVERHEFHVISNLKLETRNTHGTGCTLAAAIAAQYAKSRDMVHAVKSAIAYLHGVLHESQSLCIGTGDSGPMFHVI